MPTTRRCRRRSIPDSPSPGLRIRTITAGVTLAALDERQPLESALRFLDRARRRFLEAGYEVQSVRVATQPLGDLIGAQTWRSALEALSRLDARVSEAGALLSVGPLILSDRHDPDLADRLAELLASTRSTSCSLAVACGRMGVYRRTVRTAAETIHAVSRAEAGGEANFRFAAAAQVPAGTPFFPVAHHRGPPAFALGLESAALVAEAFAGLEDPGTASERLQVLLEERLAPLEALSGELGGSSTRRFGGIDLSPAPGLDASIAAAIESLSGAPFGAPSTLAACAAVTRTLDQARLPKCGYSGLMLPVLEDRILAQRAGEGRFGVQQLLLYSSVCGTGLDVVPLPGDCSVEHLADLILDVAALACRLHKPLAARLLPIPGKRAGEVVSFDNPHLTEAAVMPLDGASGT